MSDLDRRMRFVIALSVALTVGALTIGCCLTGSTASDAAHRAYSVLDVPALIEASDLDEDQKRRRRELSKDLEKLLKEMGTGE